MSISRLVIVASLLALLACASAYAERQSGKGFEFYLPSEVEVSAEHEGHTVYAASVGDRWYYVDVQEGRHPLGLQGWAQTRLDSLQEGDVQADDLELRISDDKASLTYETNIAMVITRFYARAIADGDRVVSVQVRGHPESWEKREEDFLDIVHSLEWD